MLQDSFITYLQVEKNYSKHTILSYQKDIEQLVAFLEEQGKAFDPITLSHYELREWVSCLMDHGISARSVNRKISSVQALYVYMQRKKICNHNPVDKVTRPKMRKKLAPFVREKDMDTLLDRIHFANDQKGLREYLILELLYLTGIRESELIGLKIRDVDLINQQIKVLGKRNKERIIPIGLPLIKSVKDYLVVRAPGMEEHLLLTDKGAPLYPGYVYKVVNTYLKQVTTVSQKSPHTLRHSFATSLLGNGADINAIKELLGHSSLSSTEIYMHNTTKKISEIYKLAHPRA